MNLKMSKRIILVSKGIVTQVRFHEYGMEYLVNNKYEVIIWIVGKSKEEDINCFDSELPNCKTRYFANYYMYALAVKRNRDCIFFLPEIGTPELIYPFSRYGCIYIQEGIRSMTCYNSDYDWPLESEIKKEHNFTLAQTLKEWYQRNKKDLTLYIFKKPIRMINSYLDKKYVRMFGDWKLSEYLPSRLFVTNDKAYKYTIEKMGGFNIPQDIIVYSPSNVYNYYLENESENDSISEDFILYCVSGLGYKIKGIRESVYSEKIYEPEVNRKYLLQIEKMLDALENHYNMKVIVAGHPRGDYGSYDFGGRTIEYGKTCELTKKCKIFVTAYSTSIAYPVLYDKDILFFYSDVIKESRAWNYSYVPLIRELGIRGINMDNEAALLKPWDYIEKVDNNKKKSFIEGYYNVLNDNRLFGKIIMDELDAIYQEGNC